MRNIRLLLSLFLWLILIAISLPSALAAAPVAATSILLSPVGVEARNAAIAVSASGVIHAVWEQDGGLWHRYRQGETWSAATQIVASGESPVLAAANSGQTVYLAWSQVFGGDYEIFASRWEGAAWSEPQNVSSNDGGSSTPALAVSPTGIVHLVWSDTSAGAAMLYHAVSDDGLTWPSAQPIPNAPGANPTAAFDAAGDLHVAWQHRPSFGDKLRIWTTRFHNSWLAPVALTDGSQQALAAHLAAGAGKLVLTWQEGEQIHLALRTSDSWANDATAAGRQPDVVVLPDGALFWGWEQQDRLVARFGNAGWSGLVSLTPQAGPESRELALAVQGDQISSVWSAQAEQKWQVFFDSLRLAKTYLPQMR